MSDIPVTSSGDHAHAHSPRTGHRILDLAIAISAITISVISLFVAIEHGKTERELVAANSWPFLTYTQERRGSSAARGDVVELRIENPGVGPANVKSLVVLLDGKVALDHQSLVERCCGYKSTGFAGDVKAGASAFNQSVGIIPARDRRILLQWTHLDDKNTELFERLVAADKRITLRGCYCSVLNQCWVTDLRSSTTPRPVKACAADPNTFRG